MNLIKKLSTFIFVVLLLSTQFLFANPSQSNSLSIWQDAPSLPYRVQEIYPTIFANHIVVAGGLSPDVDERPINVSNRVVIFDLHAQVWHEAASLPEPRHHPMLVVVNGKLLSFGGFVKGQYGVWQNSTDVLELVGEDSQSSADVLKHGRWKKIANMPKPLAETLSAVHEGKVHLISGRTPQNASKNSQWNDQTDVSTHYIFDPANMKWSQGKTVPTARNSACSVSLNGKMHTIAGRTVAGGNLAVHEALNLKTQTWQTLAPLPQAQGGLACAAVNEKIYVFGGEYFNNGGGVYADVWEYSPNSNAWRSVSKMPTPRHGLGALSIEDKIYVLAGAAQAGGNQTSNIMTIFSPNKLFK